MRSLHLHVESFVTLGETSPGHHPASRLSGAAAAPAVSFAHGGRGRLAVTLVASAAAIAAVPSHALSQKTLGDVLATALPVATLGTELYRGDREGAWQYALSFTTTFLSTEVLKRVTHVERPDGSDHRSFPSGHAARAFSAAAYVRERHGLDVAAPLYAVALYVGYTRVNADEHRWTDIAGAALVAEVAALWLVQRAPELARARHVGRPLAPRAQLLARLRKQLRGLLEEDRQHVLIDLVADVGERVVGQREDDLGLEFRCRLDVRRRA